MTTIKSFEELLMFKKSRELTREIYKSFSLCKDNGFKDQIQRASVSILSNIAEGFESGSKQNFIHYLFISKASAGEVRAQLYVALDVGYLNIEKFKYLNGLATECSRLIASFVEKSKQGSEAGLLYKKAENKGDLMLEKLIKDNDLVMTEKGFKSRNEAKEKGYRIFEY